MSSLGQIPHPLAPSPAGEGEKRNLGDTPMPPAPMKSGHPGLAKTYSTFLEDRTLNHALLPEPDYILPGVTQGDQDLSIMLSQQRRRAA